MLLQADLTAVAPGPLEPELARRLQLAADVESRGGATVYRFTARSVRRALDVGWTAAELHDVRRPTVSRTPVPQPLTYLIDDTARTYGTVRVGHAEAFLRADDEAALTELLRAPAGGLPRAAPARADRAHQHHARSTCCSPGCASWARRPAVEAPDGVAARRPARRAAGADAQGARRPPSARPASRRPSPRVIAAIRAGDRAVAERPAGPAGAHAQ